MTKRRVRKVPDLRVGVSVRNNLILTKMEAMGFKRVSQLARASGITYYRLRRLVNMNRPAKTADGNWHNDVMSLAKLFNCCPEDLFSEFIFENALQKDHAFVEMHSAELRALCSYNQVCQLDPAEVLESQELHSALKNALDTLTELQRRVLEACYGLDEQEKLQHREIGRLLGRTAKSVHNIQLVAIRKLRHPSRAEPLREARGR